MQASPLPVCCSPAAVTDHVHHPAPKVPGGGLRGPQLQPLVHHGPSSLRSYLRREWGGETLPAGVHVRSHWTAVRCSHSTLLYFCWVLTGNVSATTRWVDRITGQLLLINFSSESLQHSSTDNTISRVRTFFASFELQLKHLPEIISGKIDQYISFLTFCSRCLVDINKKLFFFTSCSGCCSSLLSTCHTFIIRRLAK